MQTLRLEVTKFTIVGAGSFLLTFVIYAAALELTQMHYLLALAAAWTSGVLFTYACNVLWVFRAEGQRPSWWSFVRYALSSGVSVTINGLALAFIVERFGTGPFLTQLALVPFVVVFNFVASKYWALRVRAERQPVGQIR